MLETPQTEPESLTERKRLRVSEENEEDRGKKRSRGRPRLDTRDETAQDRRRTQIRLAQRAYRNRKDTAITTLEDKVKDLEDANENMSKEFMNFFDFVLSQGMLQGAPEVARRLNDTTRKFLSLTRKSAEDSSRDESGDNLAPAPIQGEDTTQPPERRISAHSSNTSSSPSDDLSASNPSVPHTIPHDKHQATPQRGDGQMRQQATPPLNLPYEIITMPTTDNASFPVYDTQTPINLEQNPFLQSPFPAVPSPPSYSSQERSFGRRLQRAALEAGLRLASMANPPPHRYAQVFGFCLLFEPRESIVDRISTTLSRISQESLFVWRYPFTNLGGTGTFFPDNEGASGYSSTGSNSTRLHLGNQGLIQSMKPPEMTGFSMGPFAPNVETTRDRVDERMRMMFKGFDGDFFDADEAEAYLRQKGVVIPANVDFVDAEIDIGSLGESTDLSGFGTNSNSFFGAHQTPVPDQGLYMPPQPSATDVPGMWRSAVPTSVASTTSPMTAASLMAPTIGPDMAGFIPQLGPTNGEQYGQGMGSFMDTSYLPREWASGSSWMKTRVTVDVNRLVAEMTSMAVCLGRSPAIRPKDIDKAVKLAIVLTQS
ncbi:bzip family transcription factor [Fusarium sporotrichioides]|uniref:Bzip family transcription factor n=1 Tax=Fusarium sporotrichioides TaxID=5514 RepID=A0A395SRF7_FUSSP|nr:bzip family transcription factor [Fusarium sporotrichioides]